MNTGQTKRFVRRGTLAAGIMLAAGCAHVGKPVAKNVAPATQAATRIIPNPPAAGQSATAPSPAFPAEYEEYYVGMIADTDDPSFAYRPGDLIVQTRPARFRLDGQGRPDPISFLPAGAARMANAHPEPAETEIAAIVFRSQRAISALTEQNEALLAQVDNLQKAAPAPPQAIPPTPDKGGTKPAAVDKANDEGLNVVSPNGEYVIELDPNFFVTPSPTTTNPFVQLYQPPVTLHDLDLTVSAAVPGPNPSAIINDEPYSIGDNFKGLTVYRIDADTVYLRKDSFLLACPVSQKTLKLRLP